MKLLGSLLVASTLVLGCQNESKLDTAGGSNAGTAGLEARIAKLEADNAKYKEALEFLQKVYNQQKAQQEAQEEAEPDPDAIFAVDIANDIKAGQIEGSKDAPITIVDAFDFACPYCRKVNETLEELVKSYDGKVRVVYKNMIVHPQVATTAHMASCAAAKQGKYLAFKKAFWVKGFDAYAAARDPSKLGEDNVMLIAKDAGLDTDKLKADMKSADCQKQIQEDMQELSKFKVNSTPTLYVNGTVVGGALPIESFKQLIDDKLSKLGSSAGADTYDKEVMAKGEKQFKSKGHKG